MDETDSLTQTDHLSTTTVGLQQQQHQVSQLVQQSIITETFFCNDIMTSIARFLTWTDILSLRVALGIVDCDNEDDDHENTIHARCISRDIQRTNIIPLKSVMDVRMECNYSFTKSFASIYVDVMDTFHKMLFESVDTRLSNITSASDPTMKHVLTSWKEQFTKLRPTTTAHIVRIASNSSHHHDHATNATFYDEDNFCHHTAWLPAYFSHTDRNQSNSTHPLFHWKLPPFDAYFNCTHNTIDRVEMYCRFSNPDKLEKYQKIASLPNEVIDDGQYVKMTWNQYHVFNYASTDFYFQKLVDASQSRNTYQPMPYRLGNPTFLYISRYPLDMEQNSISEECTGLIHMFNIYWDVPITPYLGGSMCEFKCTPHMYLRVSERSVYWKKRDACGPLNVGLLRPCEISIENGCLTFEWFDDWAVEVDYPTLHNRHNRPYPIKTLIFHNNGGITETVREAMNTYFPPSQITDSYSYHLFPWFNDVYNRMDIFSCGLCPHTASICGRDYAIVMRFCFAKTLQDISTPPPPQERQFHIQVDNDELYFDVRKKYPAYFQLVPLD
jgi:hypothetical protein